MASRSEVEDTVLRRVQYTGQPRGPSGFPVMAVNSAVAAAGSDNTDAGAIAQGGFTRVTGADATKGVILPDLEIGSIVVIKNNAAAILKIYPNAGAGINAGTVTTGAYSLAASVVLMLIRESATVWTTIPHVGS